MKRNQFFLMIAFVIISVQSCNLWIIDPEEPQPVQCTLGAYVLNSGSYGSNNASLTLLNTVGLTTVENCFEAVNGIQLGDTAQDIYVYGSKMYISVYGSGVIFALDKITCKVLAEIRAKSDHSDACLSPKYFEAKDGKMYVSYYEGYVGMIDTTNLNVTKLVKVGDNPEQIAIASGKLYVANSGGMNYPSYGNTVSVLNTDDLSLIKTLTVVENPNYLEVDNEGDVYVISFGNYADIPASFQRIDTRTDVVTEIESVKDPYRMSMGKNDQMIMITSKYDEEWNTVTNIIEYCTRSDVEKNAGVFIKDATAVPDPYSVTVDKVSGAVYLCCSNYKNTGKVFIYYPEGKYMHQFSAAGINPETVAFVRNFE